MKNAISEADKQLKKIVFFAIIIIATIAAALYFNRSTYSGTIKGRVVSTTITQADYKSITGTTRANIQLDNGAVIYKDIYGAKAGDIVVVSVYKSRITGAATYR